MGCLLAVFAGLFPRFALIIFWIARPERMDATFTTFLWPLFGIMRTRGGDLALAFAGSPRASPSRSSGMRGGVPSSGFARRSRTGAVGPSHLSRCDLRVLTAT
jgi:hypothetical protein